MRLLLCIVCLYSVCFAKVRILTFHYNQANFIELQYKTLTKFLDEEFELIVFNDAKTKENEAAIQDVCHTLGIQCIRFSPEWHFASPLNDYLLQRIPFASNAPWGWGAHTNVNDIANHPSVRHCHVIQHALDHYGYNHDDLVVILDGDCFLIRPLSLRALMGSNDIVSLSRREDLRGEQRKRGRVAVPDCSGSSWIASVIFITFDPRQLPDVTDLHFHVDMVKGHESLPDGFIGDSGIAAYAYAKRHPEVKIKEFFWHSSSIFRAYFTREELVRMGFQGSLLRMIYDIVPENVQLFAAEHFVHFSAASFENPGHHRKANRFAEFIEEICATAFLK